MSFSLKNKIIDYYFDVIDFYLMNKKYSHMLFSSLIIGITFGFSMASVIQYVPDSALIRASIIIEEDTTPVEDEELEVLEVHSSAETIEIPVLSEEELQKIYMSVITDSDVGLCEIKLQDDSDISNCKDNYWNIQASIQFDAALCSKIFDPIVQIECQKNTETLETEALAVNKNLSEEEIQIKSEECLNKKEANQNICWNSLFLSIAIADGDLEKCSNIKDSHTKNTCIIKTEKALDKKYKQEAQDTVTMNICDKIIDNEIKTSCKEGVLEKLLVVSDLCDQACVDAEVIKMATENLNKSYCYKGSDDNQSHCLDLYYIEDAKVKKDSRICEKIISEKEQNACIESIDELDDKNPEVQIEVFRKSDPSFPEIGSTLPNPMNEGLGFEPTSTSIDLDSIFNSNEAVTEESLTSVLEDLRKIELEESVLLDSPESSSELSVCNAYPPESLRRIDCEDSLILQKALSEKKLVECSRIQDKETQEYCELEIVETEAEKSAAAAKAKCSLLSNTGLQQKCLKNLGFFTQETENNNNKDCLDYTNPQERIMCMRAIR